MQTDELRGLLVGLFPAFQEQWDQGDNLHRDGDAFTPHGLCSAFSSFYVGQELPLYEPVAKRLFAAIEQVVSADADDKDPVANALCTCFLENIANTSVGEASAQIMGPASRKYFEFWHAGA
jgi:hypothetical protein